MLRNVCRGLGGTNMEAELKVLTRQGVARSTGTVSMMQSLRVIDTRRSRRQSHDQSTLSTHQWRRRQSHVLNVHGAPGSRHLPWVCCGNDL